MENILTYDSSFNEAEFLSRVANIYVMLCNSLMLEDLERVKHMISKQVFDKYNNLLDTLQKNNERQMFDELNVKTSNITDIRVDDNNIYIDVTLISRYLNYVIDKQINKLKRGNNNTRVELNNYLTFVKKRETKKQSIARTCPNCGAHMDINYNGKCAYCGSIYNTSDFDYILDSIVTDDIN